MTVYIVAGPPGSGKTTWVKKQVMETDIVIDLDLLGEAITLKHPHRRPVALLDLLIRMRDRLMSDAMQLHRIGKIYNIWYVTGSPRSWEREEIQIRAGSDSQVIVFEISPNDCMKHINKDLTRGPASHWIPLVKKWWDAYEPREGERKIRYQDLIES